MISDEQEKLKLISTRVGWLVLLCQILSGLFLATGYSLNSLLYLGLFSLVVSGFGILARNKNTHWISNLVFFSQTALSAAGFYLDIEFHWLISGMVLALIAWDLQALYHTLQHVERVDRPTSLVYRHLSRLLIVGTLGSILAFITLSIQLEISFGWLVLFSLISILGLSFAIGYLIRRTQS